MNIPKIFFKIKTSSLVEIIAPIIAPIIPNIIITIETLKSIFLFLIFIKVAEMTKKIKTQRRSLQGDQEVNRIQCTRNKKEGLI